MNRIYRSFAFVLSITLCVISASQVFAESNGIDLSFSEYAWNYDAPILDAEITADCSAVASFDASCVAGQYLSRVEFREALRWSVKFQTYTPRTLSAAMKGRARDPG